MRCPICKGSIKRGKTNFPVEIGEGLLFVKEVPSNICQQCGEVFIPDKIAASLEKMVSKARENKIEIEVLSYKKVA